MAPQEPAPPELSSGSAVPTLREEEFETALFKLLASLERIQASVQQPGRSPRAVLAIACAKEIIMRLVDFAEQWLPAEQVEAAFVKAQDAFTSVNQLHKQVTKLPARSLEALFDGEAADPNGLRFRYRQAGQLLGDVIRHYQQLFAGAFATPTKAQQWSETLRVFQAEVARCW